MRTWIGALAVATLLASSGCNSLQYMETEELWAHADAAFDAGRYGDAIPYYDEILSRSRENARAYLFRGISRERDSDALGAFRDYARAGDLGDPRGLLYRVDLALRSDDLAGATGDLGRLKDMGLRGRDRVAQLVLLATLRLKQNRPRLAAQNAERALREGEALRDPGAEPFLASARYTAAHAYYRLGDFQRAYEHFDRYMSSPEARQSPTDHYLHGLLAYLAGDYVAANEHLAQADPDLVDEAASILDDPSFGAGER